ncbi:MAG: hypothetical protein WC712_08815 [Candidatus Brocadiia bacterium]
MRPILVFALLGIFLASLACFPYAEEPNKPDQAFVTKQFDLSMIVGPNVVKYPKLGFDIEHEAPFSYIEDDLLTVDDLVTLIYNQTGPENWTDPKTTFIAAGGGGRIIVRNTPVMVDKVAEAIHRLSPKAPSYTLDARLFVVPPDRARNIEEGGFVKMEDYVKAIGAAEGVCVFSANQRIVPGRTYGVCDTRKQPYVGELSAKMAALAVGYDTITFKVTTGRTLIIKATEAEDGIDLFMAYDSCDLLAMDSFEVPGGKIEKPILRFYSFSPSVKIAEGGISCLAFTSDGERFIFVLSLK